MIELRWLSKAVDNGHAPVIRHYEKVLQYRQKPDYTNLPKNFDTNWSDWQDVTEV